MDFTRHSRLRSFFKNDVAPQKRLKTLTAYLATCSFEERQQFHRTHYFTVYGVILDSLQLNRYKNETVGLEEAISVLNVFESLMIDIKEQLQTRWQARSIGNLLTQLLAYDNHFKLRQRGLGLLLMFMDVVGGKVDTKLSAVLCRAINYLPCCIESTSVRTREHFESISIDCPDSFNFGKVTTMQTEAESVELLTFVFDFTICRMTTDRCEFWLRVMYDSILPYLYPNAYSSSTNGFRPLCPPSLHGVVVSWLHKLVAGRQAMHSLWENRSFAAVVDEIFRQTFHLSAEFELITISVLTLFRSWIQGINIPDAYKLDLQAFLQMLMGHLIRAIDGLVRSDTSPARRGSIRVCSEVVALFQMMSLEPHIKMSSATWEVLLLTLLNAATSAMKANQVLPSVGISEVTHSVLGAVVDAFVRSRTHDVKVWNAFRDHARHWRQSLQFMKQWKHKIVELTRALVDQFECELQRRSSCENAPADEFPVLFRAWDNLLHLVGDPNDMSSVSMAKIALDGIVECVDVFIDSVTVSRAQPKAAQAAVSRSHPISLSIRSLLPSGNTLMSIFGPSLLQAAENEAPERLSCRCKALVSLSRIILTRCPQQYDEIFLASYYVVIQRALQSTSFALKCTVIRATVNLFCVDLPGSEMLIPSVFDVVRSLLTDSRGCDEDVLCSCLTILSSLLPIARLDSSKLAPVECSTKTIYDMLTTIIRGKYPSLVTVRAMWILCVYVFEVLPDGIYTDEMIYLVALFVERSTSPDCTLSKHSLLILRTLLCLRNDICCKDEGILLSIVSGLTSRAMTLISKLSRNPRDLDLWSKKEPCASRIVYCLVEWVVACSQQLVKNQEMLTSVFHVLNAGMVCISAAQSSNDCSQNELRDFDSIGDACRAASSHLLYRLGNYPLATGGDYVCSIVDEENDEMDSLMKDSHQRHLNAPFDPALHSVIHMVYGEGTILSVAERMSFDPQQNEVRPIARIVIRDMTGKYVWDCALANRACQVEGLPRLPSLDCCESDNEEFRSSDEETAAERSTSATDPDALTTALDYIDSQLSSDDLLEQRSQQCEEFECSIERDLDSISQQIESQFEQERELLLRCKAGCGSSLDSRSVPVSPFDSCRIFLASLGLMFPFNRQGTRLQLLQSGPKLQRSLKLLDQNSGREVHKIGVVYVRKGQDNQRIILRNESGSPEYEDFVDGLGWPVNLATHRGFMGGLDRRLTTGDQAPYYATSTIEAIFHVVTRMPTDWNDQQQIVKKRQVGNDHVHVVWSEHSRDYLASTISSHFNDVHIVLYPLKRNQGYCRVQIHAKQGVPLFGPLFDGMIVSFKSLAALTRETALNANRERRRTASGSSQHPYLTRLMYINDIIGRQIYQASPPDFLAPFFPGLEVGAGRNLEG